MAKRLFKILIYSFLSITILTTNIGFFPIKATSALENKKSNLLDKVSADFTKKYCNSIGFGLSKESAFNFSLSENKKQFKNRKGIESLDKELLSNKIALSVFDRCGYESNLNGEKDILEFANLYLSIEKEN